MEQKFRENSFDFNDYIENITGKNGTCQIVRKINMTDEQKKAILDKAHNAKSEQEMNQIVNSLAGNKMQ